MKVDKRIDNLSLLNNAFRDYRSFYTIGAGVSKGIVPLNKELSKEILKSVFSRAPGIPVDRPKYDEDSCNLYRRVIGQRANVYDLAVNYKDFAEAVRGAHPSWYLDLMSSSKGYYANMIIPEYLSRIPPGALYGLTAQALTPAKDKVIEKKYQYAMFSLIAKPSAILSLNTDGIGAKYCIGHHYFQWHGCVKSTHSSWWNELIDASFLYEFEFPKIPGWTPPGPEPRTVLSRRQRWRAERLFAEANFVVIIGYSFGIFEQSFDDLPTFEWLCDLLKRYAKNVLIVDPNPWNSELIGSRINEATGRNTAHILRVSWDCLCRAMMEIGTKSSLREILYRHDKLADEDK